MMKSGNIYLLLTTLVLFLSGCDKESKLSPTENLGLVDMFSPDENADPRVRQFLDGIADGPVPFRFPAGDYRRDLIGTGS